MPITAQQAATLLEQGQITQDQFRQIVGQAPAQSPAINAALAGAGLQPPAAPAAPAPTSPFALQLTPGAAPPAPFLPLAAPPARPLPSLPNAAALAQATGTIPDAGRVRPSEAVDLALREPVGTTAARAARAAAAPGAGAPGPAAMGGGLIPYPEAGTRPHALGNTPSEKAYIKELKDRADRQIESTNRASESLQGFQDTFHDETARAAADAKANALSMEAAKAGDDLHRRHIEAEYHESQAKIASQLSSLEQQGIDPKGYFHKLGTGGTILAGIAAAMGAFGAHPLGPHGTASQNYALDIINRGISDDLDAQRTNLQKSLSVLRSRMDVGKEGFDHNMAMLKAERDSTETAYQVAQNEIARRQAMFRDNADVGTKLATLKDQVFQSGQDRVNALNDRIFEIRRHAEQVVGGQPDRTQQIRDLAIKLTESAAANGQELTPVEAQKKAAELVTGVDINPGVREATIAKQPKGAGAGKAAESLSHLDAAIGAIDRIAALRRQHGGGTLSGEDRARGQSDALLARAGIGKAFGGRMNEAELHALQATVPENPLELQAAGLIGSDPNGARMQETRRMLMAQRAVLQQQAAGGGAGAAPETPEQLGGEKDE